MPYLSGMRAGAFSTLPIAAFDPSTCTIKQWTSLGVETKNHKAATTYLLEIPDLLAIAQEWNELGVHFERHFLVDTTPVMAAADRRDKRYSDSRGSAQCGYCSARRLKYFGYTLVMLTTLDGAPYGLDLIPPNTEKRDATGNCQNRQRDPLVVLAPILRH